MPTLDFRAMIEPKWKVHRDMAQGNMVATVQVQYANANGLGCKPAHCRRTSSMPGDVAVGGVQHGAGRTGPQARRNPYLPNVRVRVAKDKSRQPSQIVT